MFIIPVVSLTSTLTHPIIIYHISVSVTHTAQPREPISITLPSGDVHTGTSFITTPYQIATSISQTLADKIIISKLDSTQLWDLHRPLEKSCSLKLLTFEGDAEDPDVKEARQVFWHSSAHVLGEAAERHLDGCCLGYGPPQENGGFFYEMRLKDNRWVLFAIGETFLFHLILCLINSFPTSFSYSVPRSLVN